jgi:hypothetical protein
MKTRVLAAAAALVAVAGVASAGELSTVYAGGNGNSLGGGAYFDVAVAGTALTITGFRMNSDAALGVTSRFEVWTINEPISATNTINAAGWSLAATGTLTGIDGLGNSEDPVVLDNTFNLAANSTTGFAIRLLDTTQNYTNGNGANQFFSNADMSISLGRTSNAWLSGSTFFPRVWNGTIIYEAVPAPASLAMLGLGGLVAGRRRR